MGFGVSLFLVAVGAILTVAVTTTVEGIDLDAAGIILMVVGAVGFLWAVIARMGEDDRHVVQKEEE